MGWFKKALGGIGDIAKYAAPVLAMTGVGAPLAAGIGLAGGVLGQANNKKFSLGKGLLEGAASGGSAYALGNNGGLGATGRIGNWLKGGTSVANVAGGGGGGLSTLDKWGLGLGALGSAAGAYGAYQQGQGADEDRAVAARQWESEFGRQTGLDTEDRRRYDQDFGESSRRYGLDFGEGQRQFDLGFGENQRQFNENLGFNREQFGEDTRRWDTSRADTRGDIEYERDLMNRKGRAVSPFVGRLLRLGA